MRKKSEEITIKAINGVRLSNPIVNQAWTNDSGMLWVYPPPIIEDYLTEAFPDMIRDIDENIGTTPVKTRVLLSKEVGKLQIALYRSYERYYLEHLKEYKIIVYGFKGMPDGMQLSYAIYWKIIFPDGMIKITTHSFNTFKTQPANRRNEWTDRDFGGNYIKWTAEKEETFKLCTASIEEWKRKIKDLIG